MRWEKGQNPTAFLTLLGRLLPREPLAGPPAVISFDFGYRRPEPPSLPTLSYDMGLAQIADPALAKLGKK
jgi:hypothetical protein